MALALPVMAIKLAVSFMKSHLNSVAAATYLLNS